jgi:hypothetical protein
LTTQSQITANQANSEKSTGPKTEAGKLNASRNSWRHGLSASVFMVLEEENPEIYRTLLQAMYDQYQPVTPTEAILVEGMAQHH